MSRRFFSEIGYREDNVLIREPIFPFFPRFVPGPKGTSCYFYSCWGFPIFRYLTTLFDHFFSNSSSAQGCSCSWPTVLHSSYLHPKLPPFPSTTVWSFQYKTEMASQYNFVHPAAQAPAVNTKRIQVNDKFAQTADLRTAAQRSFMIDGRTV